MANILLTAPNAKVWEARGEYQHDHERQRVAAPRTCHEQVARDGAHAYGVHVERTGGRRVGHCQDDKGFQGVGGFRLLPRGRI